MCDDNRQDMDWQPGPLLIDAAAVAKLLSIGRSTFFALISSGRIGPQPIRLGKRRLYRRNEIDDWVLRGCPPRRQWRSE
jgi:excisionase family DNA binding protein